MGMGWRHDNRANECGEWGTNGGDGKGRQTGHAGLG